jgi:hypothetical protein
MGFPLQKSSFLFDLTKKMQKQYFVVKIAKVILSAIVAGSFMGFK